MKEKLLKVEIVKWDKGLVLLTWLLNLSYKNVDQVHAQLKKKEREREKKRGQREKNYWISTILYLLLVYYYYALKKQSKFDKEKMEVLRKFR